MLCDTATSGRHRLSALQEAIARRVPSSSLDAASPLHGLQRGSVTTVDLVAQSVAAVAPAGVLLAQTGGLLSRAGSFAYLDLVLTAITVLLVALSMSVFARRIAAAGGVYTFVTRSIGPVVGFVAGAAIALGYASVAIDTLRSGVRRLGGLITAESQPTEGNLLLVALVVAIGVVITAVIALGARMSTRVLLVVEVITVSAILVVSTAVFAGTGWNVSGLVPDWGNIPPLDSFASGIGLALVGFVGFESGAALGPESRRPLSNVPRALVWTASAIAVVYLFSVAAQLSAAATGTSEGTLLSNADQLAAIPWIEPTIDGVIAASWIACTIACSNALVRLVFTMAREGVLPRALGRTSVRFGTPHVAAVVGGGILVAGTLLVLQLDRETLLREVISLSTSVGFIVAYVLVCAGAVVYLARIGEFSLREAWPALLGTVALLAVMATTTIAEAESDLLPLLAFAAVVAVATIVHAVRYRFGSLRRGLGAYDTPVASDSLSAEGERTTPL